MSKFTAINGLNEMETFLSEIKGSFLSGNKEIKNKFNYSKDILNITDLINAINGYTPITFDKSKFINYMSSNFQKKNININDMYYVLADDDGDVIYFTFHNFILKKTVDNITVFDEIQSEGGGRIYGFTMVGEYFYFQTSSGRIHIYDIREKAIIKTIRFPIHTLRQDCVKYVKKLNTVFCFGGHYEKGILLTKINTTTHEHEEVILPKKVEDIIFLKGYDGYSKYVLTTSEDGLIETYDLERETIISQNGSNLKINRDLECFYLCRLNLENQLLFFRDFKNTTVISVSLTLKDNGVELRKSNETFMIEILKRELKYSPDSIKNMGYMKYAWGDGIYGKSDMSGKQDRDVFIVGNRIYPLSYIDDFKWGTFLREPQGVSYFDKVILNKKDEPLFLLSYLYFPVRRSCIAFIPLNKKIDGWDYMTYPEIKSLK